MLLLAYRYLRRKLTDYGFYPESRLARVALAILVVDLLLVVVRKVMYLWQRSAAGGDSLITWIVLLTVVWAILTLALVLRWIRQHLLWRLRNRLIVTYVFIGVIPIVLLVLMGWLAAYLFVGQFGTYVVTGELRSETHALESARRNLQRQLEENGSVTPGALTTIGERFPLATVVTWRDGEPAVLRAPQSATAIAYPAWTEPEHDFVGLTLDHDGLFLRTFKAFGDQQAVAISIPIDRAWLEQVAGDLGHISIYQLAPEAAAAPGDIRTTTGDKENHQAAVPKMLLSAGTLGASRGRWDTTTDFVTNLHVHRWEDGKPLDLGYLVSTRPSLLYAKLFASLGKDPDAVMYVLVGTAIFLGLIELSALFIGVRLTRSVTRSIADLYRGTQHVNRGDFRYRIKVRGNDQLAELERSFNGMTTSLEKLLAEQKEKERMQSELAIAQEVQDQLFPHQDIALAALEVHGVCRAARMVSGDYYDFVPFGPQHLGIAVGDISGKGISAALMMATVHSAVRAYELIEQTSAVGVAHNSSLVARDGHFSPADTMSVLNRHLYRSTPEEKYATLFLAVFDGDTRTLTYANAGHLPPFIVSPDGSARKLEVGGLVVGLFDDQSYEEKHLQLHAGDIFVAYSDGATEPENEFGEFGEARLLEIVREHRREPLANISEAVITAVTDWIGGGEQPDDITVVLARVR